MKFPMYLATIFSILLIMSACRSSEQNNESQTMKTMDNPNYQAFVGTYTKFATNGLAKAKGVYSIFTDKNSGKITLDTLSLPIDNPSFLALSPDKKVLYISGDEISDAEIRGKVYACKILPNRQLSLINAQSSLGNSACHVAVDQKQQFLFTANYSTGNAAVYRILSDQSISEPIHEFSYTGSGPHKNQNASHPHQVVVSPDNKYVYIPDLGVDKIHAYQINAEANAIEPLDIEPIQLPPGSGPRHMTFHPNGQFAYVINELASTVQAFRYNESNGNLEKIELYSTLPEGYTEESYCADIHIDDTGQYLYGSNRGHNSLVAYKIDQSTGQLDVIGHYSVEGNWPRNFAISPDNQYIYVANRKTGNITTLKRNLSDGSLELLSKDFMDINEPICILFTD